MRKQENACDGEKEKSLVQILTDQHTNTLCEDLVDFTKMKADWDLQKVWRSIQPGSGEEGRRNTSADFLSTTSISLLLFLGECSLFPLEDQMEIYYAAILAGNAVVLLKQQVWTQQDVLLIWGNAVNSFFSLVPYYGSIFLSTVVCIPFTDGEMRWRILSSP